ncbi:RNA polymerase subunit sigma-70 [Streptomyces hydrogenans]|uniref:RNA polymerase subunit sigma-70 n=1 Tax=Streptomyces hydrogenans TaxID=1873719 RepID=UPI0035D73B67
MQDDSVVTALGARFDADEERLRGVALRLLGGGAEREAEAVLARVRNGLGTDAPGLAGLWLTALVIRACRDGAGHARGAGGNGIGHDSGAGGGRGTGVDRDSGTDRGIGVGGDSRTDRGIGVGGDSGSGSGIEAGRGIGAGDSECGRGIEAGTGIGGGTAYDGPDDAVLLGFLAVLGRLGSRERVAYLLHDVFGLAPGETARVMGGSAAEAARRARWARERLRGGAPPEPARGRRLVDAFLAAARARDAAALAVLLDPEAVLHGERGPVHGPAAVAVAAAALARPGALVRPVLVDGAVGVVASEAGRPVAALAFAFRRDRIVGVDVTTGEERVRALDLVFPEG